MKYFNNPFNIRSGSKWLGLVGTKNGFCEFSKVEYSVRVFVYLVRKTYVKRLGKDYTLEQFINTYCPVGDGDNNPHLYLDFVLNFMLGRNVILTKLSHPADFSFNVLRIFATAVCKLESNYSLSYSEFYVGYHLS